jgi:hypothetical protein
MNPIIIVAIVLQIFISRVSRMAGAIVSYLITTGILLWGLSLYSVDSGIVFFGVPLSEPAFLVLCLVWYGFDTRALLRAQKLSQKNAPTPQTDMAAQSVLMPQSDMSSQNQIYSYPGKPEGLDPSSTYDVQR